MRDASGSSPTISMEADRAQAASSFSLKFMVRERFGAEINCACAPVIMPWAVAAIGCATAGNLWLQRPTATP